MNIAARLESMSVEGGVFISKEVQDQLVNQKDFDGVSLGLQSLKGVGRLIEVYGLKGKKLNIPNPKNYHKDKIKQHSKQEVPSLAIIPFKNKGDKKHEFYSYGISVDLISDCSNAGIIRVSSLEQIEEVSKLNFKEKIDKLNVRYIVSGSLWKLDNIFQLSIELYDSIESKIVWSDRWEEDWENLSTIKSKLADGILKTLNLVQKQSRDSIQNNKAYELYLKANTKFKNALTLNEYEKTIDL